MTKTPTNHPNYNQLGIPTTPDGYLDLNTLQARADEKRQQRVKESNSYLEKISQEALKKQRNNQKLFGKALQQIKKDNEVRKEKEVAKVTAEAVARAEREAERKFGVKTEKTKKLDKAYKETLKNLF